MNKATVFSVGNRLAKAMDRHDAFVQAWQIVKSGSVTFPLRGVTQGNRQEALRRLAKYEPDQVRAFIMPEPENEFDHNALAVMVFVNGGKGIYKLGYIPAKETAKAAAIEGKASLRVVSSVWGFAGNTTFGGRITLAV
jgi:hypothetical protein